MSEVIGDMSCVGGRKKQSIVASRLWQLIRRWPLEGRSD
jgi:hypothetical protein